MTDYKLSFKKWKEANPGKSLLFPSLKSKGYSTCVNCGTQKSVSHNAPSWRMFCCESCGTQTALSLGHEMRRRRNGLGEIVPF